MAAVPIVNFTEKRGDTLDYLATFLNVDLTAVGTLIWFTGKTAKTQADASAIWQKIIGSGVVVLTPTTATLTLVPADTAGLNDGAAVFYDVQILTPTGRVQTAFEGTITFESDVTQSVV